MTSKQPIYKAGTTIAEKYRIDKAIARGGCSIVYRGTHVGMERSVALKIMSLVNGRVDPSWAARFQREAKLASQLQHPNTITTFDYGEWNGIFYIVMEWVEGLSLRNLIREHGALSSERTARITMQILRSLHEAHRNKILHRDMKPSNIMITTDLDDTEIVKVLDFGLAKAQHSEFDEESLKLTRDGDFIGTPRYASPEQLRGEQLTPASDLYGVGMVMWEMLMAEPAVPSVDYGTCIQHHLGPHPWELPHGVADDGLALIVERALAKHPTGRYQTCKEMLEALDEWLSSYFVKQESSPFLDTNAAVSLLEQDADLQGFDDLANSLGDLDDDLPPMDFAGPARRPQPNASAERPAHRTRQNKAVPQPSVGNGILDLDASKLELDTGTSADARGARNPRPMTPSRPMERVPIQSNARTSSKGLEPRTIGMLVGGAIVLVVIAVLANQLSTPRTEIVDDTEPSAGDELLDEIISGKGVQDSKEDGGSDSPNALQPHQTITSARALILLRSKGWTYTQPNDPENLEGYTQQFVRLTRNSAVADLVLFDCNTLEIARTIAREAPSDSEVVRIDTLTLHVSPPNETGTRGTKQLVADLLDLQRKALR